MQKKKYLNAKIDILYFDKKDVITASGEIGPGECNNDSTVLPDLTGNFFSN